MNPENPVADSIRHSIEKNGFPDKAVKLPFRPVYESCKKHGTPLAQVLAQLGDEGIVGTLTGDHILFQTPEQATDWAEQKHSNAGVDPLNPVSGMSGFPDGLEGLARLGGDAMKNLTPEQLKSLKENFEAMSPDEKMKLIQFYGNLFSDLKNK